LATAAELFEARHFPGVVALINDALEEEPEHVPLLLVRARANIALRRDLDAQADLRDIIRLDPQCSLAFRLLGELAARRDENESAAIFFREALRLDPDDRDAADWLAIVDTTSRPAAAATKLPAPAAAAGRFSPPRTGSDARSLSAPARPSQPARLAKGTTPPTDRDRKPQSSFDARARPISIPVAPAELARGSKQKSSWEEESPAPLPPPPSLVAATATGSEPRAPQLAKPRLGSEPPAIPDNMPIPGARPFSQGRPTPRGPIPELPGFGDYLVASGILTRERLRAAQAYQRSMRVQLSTAIVTLGLATPQRIEWAAVAHQSQLARQR
jgi:hypothetical protein